MTGGLIEGLEEETEALLAVDAALEVADGALDGPARGLLVEVAVGVGFAGPAVAADWILLVHGTVPCSRQRCVVARDTRADLGARRRPAPLHFDLWSMPQPVPG